MADDLMPGDNDRHYKDRPVLVTGADGFIGSHLVERLAAAGARVTALAHYNALGTTGWLEELDAAVADRVTVARGDIRDPAFMTRLVAKQETVFHLAALIAIPYSYAAPQSYVDTNVTGTLNLLEAARSHKVGRVVHTSTSEVYGTAITTPIAEDHPLQGQSPYSASKIGADMMAEAYARSFDLPVAILRPFNTYGPRQSERAVIPTVIRQALDPDCGTIAVGDVRPTRDFNYVTDTVDAFAAIGAADIVDYGMAYNAGSGVAVSVGDMIKQVCAITGTNKPIVTEPDRMRPEKSEVMTLLADPSRFASATGWSSSVGLKAGLAQTIEWWRDRLAHDGVRRESTYLT
jgi:NAD dependent epimerase/dehydratase